MSNRAVTQNSSQGITKVSPVPFGIVRAAHLFQCFYADRAREFCIEEGFSEEDINRGGEIAFIRKDTRQMLRSIFGDPAYGSWPEKAWVIEREELLKRGLTEEEIEETR